MAKGFLDELIDERNHLRAINAELLAALRAMTTFYGMDEEPGEASGAVFRQARAAIAKAEGRDDG